MLTDPKPGQRCRANRDIWDDGQDHHPAGYYCTAGEILVIREVEGRHVAVSHPEITDRSFWATLEEMDPIEEVAPC